MIRLLSFMLLVISGVCPAQTRLTPHNMTTLCQGLGQATATVALGREKGIPDDQNEGVQVLKRISMHSGNDFENHVNKFLARTDKLPPLWQGMLYTHACWHNYQDNAAHIRLMNALLPQRCDLATPSMGCIDKTYESLPAPAQLI